MTAAAGQSYLHSALLYGSTEELVAAAVPFLADGLAAGESVVLACREDRNRLVAEALGGDDRITLLEPAAVYTRPAQALAAQRRITRRHARSGVPRVRALAEVPVGDGRESWAEWTGYEAACNIALAPLPLSGVCAYDTRTLPEPVRLGIEQTHPALLTPGGRSPNDRCADPATVLSRTAVSRPDPVEVTTPALRLDDLTDVSRLPAVRARLRDLLAAPGPHRHRRTDFAAATTEVLANAVRHGRPPVTLRVWTPPTRLVCTVTDRGPGFDDPLAGYVPPADDPRHRAGLWLVRQSCDTLEADRDPAGFTVRLTTSLLA
ncbi:anti-sigma factor RsbA family regulatory protein [Geodermatophilus sp. SYSU D00742]